MQFFLINQSNYGIKPTYLSISMIVSPIFWLELQPMFSFLLSLTLNWITNQLTILTTMSLSEPEKTPDLPSSPVARKQSDSYALPVTPSPTKDCGSKRPSVDNEPLSHDWKTLRTTPPTKVTWSIHWWQKTIRYLVKLYWRYTNTLQNTYSSNYENDSFRWKWK